ncbi:MAG: TolC family protein [Alistipes sp.]|nr:TolC family protein [Alistipes sp.]
MKIAVTIALTAAALGLAVPAAAQQAGRPLTLDEAFDVTLSENPALKAAAYEERAATQERRAAIGLRMPQIGITGAYAYMAKDIGFDFNGLKGPAGNMAQQLLPLVPEQFLPQVSGLLGQLNAADWFLKVQDRSLGFIGGQVSVPIWLGGKINAANRAAKINERTATEQGRQTRNALISELVERYFGLSLAMQVVEVRQQVVDGVRRHLEDAEALERNGMIARSERLYVDFKMAEAERELADARLQLETISSALSNTLASEAAWRPATSMFILDRIEELEYYQDLAQERNPLLNQVSLKQQLAEEGVRVQRSAFLPQVAAIGGASFYNYQVAGLVPRWVVGVGVNIKLFDGLNREYKYSAAKQTARRVGELQQKAGQDISVLVEKLYHQLMNYRNRISSIDASLAFAEEYLRAKNLAFLEGMSSSTELIDAELNLAGIRAERLQAAYNYDRTLAQLLEAAGISDEFTAYARRHDARAILFDKK